MNGPLDNGCKFLDISLAVTLEENIKIERCELKMLDMSSFSANQVKEKLLNSCHYLEKLAMRNSKIWPNLISNMCIQNCHLQILNLANCKGSTGWQQSFHTIWMCICGSLVNVNKDCRKLQIVIGIIPTFS